MSDEKAIALGHPSYVWRFGQDRRLALINRHAPLSGKRILDVGCGLGMYVRRFRELSPRVHGVDIDYEKVAEASQELPNVVVAKAEHLPYPDGFFDVVLLHEVIEHVEHDQRVVQEACRVTSEGGRVVVFAPNRLYFFETHGIYWRGVYRFGNFPLVGYLPDRLRARLCPHARSYRQGQLRHLFDGLRMRIVVHTQIYPGYDNVVHRHPRLGGFLRKVSYALEETPLRVFGLSHLLVAEKLSVAVSEQCQSG